jgi:hypothetical protein
MFYLTSDNTFNVIIAIVTYRCDLVLDPAGVNRSGSARGPSTSGREEATTMWWLTAINTTPTTTFKGTQAFQHPHSLQRAKLHFKPHSKSSILLQVP